MAQHPDLGFQSGDYVVNTPGGGPIQPYSEHCLVCKIRDEREGELWWAWEDRTHRMFQVLCGTWWILNPQRCVFRKATYLYDKEKSQWKPAH